MGSRGEAPARKGDNFFAGCTYNAYLCAKSIMLSLQATYDGRQVRFLDYAKLPKIRRTRPVIVTFPDSAKKDITCHELHSAAQHGRAFDFLANEEEDIYSDADLKRRY